jgi:hypothetical protein
MKPAPDAPSLGEDPLVHSARREACVAFLIFTAALTYSITYCSLFGYNRPLESLTFVLGFPDWVFWGIVVPWAICTALGFWLALVVIRDDPLEQAAAPAGESEMGKVSRDG